MNTVMMLSTYNPLKDHWRARAHVSEWTIMSLSRHECVCFVKCILETKCLSTGFKLYNLENSAFICFAYEHFNITTIRNGE